MLDVHENLHFVQNFDSGNIPPNVASCPCSQ